MQHRTEYFLKNYLLNFKFRRNKLFIYPLQSTERYYRLRINIKDKSIIFNIIRTGKIEQPKRHVLINPHKSKMHTLFCCYGIEKVESSDGTVLKLEEGFDVITCCNGCGDIEVSIGVNLIDEIFYHLSAIEEYEKESYGKNVKSYYFKDSSEPINEPLVDDFYNLFTDVVNEVFEKFDISESIQRKLNTFSISLTHDVDVIKKNYYTTARYLFLLAAGFARKFDFYTIRKMRRYLMHNSDFNQISNIMHMEKGFGYKSTFFLYSNAAKDGFIAKVVDKFINPSYDIKNNGIFTNIQNAFNEAGCEIGLHSSYLAAKNYEFFQKEFNLLKNLSDGEIISNRDHFLNFSLAHTPLLLERVGVKCDATFYYNNICGFMRHKTCSPFYFYSHIDNRIVDVVEMPTVVMDSTLFNYLNCTEETAYKMSVEILNKVKKRNGVVCINWHNETSAPEYGWYSVYKDVLRWMKDSGASAYTIKEVYERLTEEDYDGAIINTK